jgi:hypothetical protein
VTEFMNGLNACATRTLLFRTYLHTFEKAVRTALSEEFSNSLASSSSGFSYDMEVSYNCDTSRFGPQVFYLRSPGSFCSQLS